MSFHVLDTSRKFRRAITMIYTYYLTDWIFVSQNSWMSSDSINWMFFWFQTFKAHPSRKWHRNDRWRCRKGTFAKICETLNWRKTLPAGKSGFPEIRCNRLTGLQPLDSITRHCRDSNFRAVFCVPFHKTRVCDSLPSDTLKIQKVNWE
jgi:hypothetical protein